MLHVLQYLYCMICCCFNRDADDSTVYVSANTVGELNTFLNFELLSVVDWIKKNRLVLNVSKTNSIIFWFKLLNVKPDLNNYINEVPIIQVQEIKLLGIIIDNKLSWSKHINKIVAKMGNSISVVKRCIKLLTNSSKK